MNDNYCLIIGNVGENPFLRKNKLNKPIVQFTLAQDVSKYSNEKGQFVKTNTNWFKVTVFGNEADRVLKYIKKSNRVCVSGRIQTSAYTNEHGIKTRSFGIIAKSVRIAGEPRGELGCFSQKQENKEVGLEFALPMNINK